jgi:hypothetical protein
MRQAIDGEEEEKGMSVAKSYEKSNNAIRYAARKISNQTEGELTDDEIVKAVGKEMARPLDPSLNQDKVAIRAFRENRRDAERASKGRQ